MQYHTLFQSLLAAQILHGNNHHIIEDIERKPLNYRQFICRCFILGRQISKHSKYGEFVGVMLPNMTSTVVTFFALQAYGMVPAMLNFSTGTKNIIAACVTAQIKTVYSSRRLIDAADLRGVVEALIEAGVNIIYLEDVSKKISFLDKIRGFVESYFPQHVYAKIEGKKLDPRLRGDDSGGGDDSGVDPRLRGDDSGGVDDSGGGDDSGAKKPAVILFTSGSEGMPKAVVLSHLNIQANCSQLASVVDFGPSDIMFNAMPIFHSFGLTGGTLLPLLFGVKAFFYPSPLHYRIIPKVIYDTNATIIFGTDTFFTGYAKFARAPDFSKLRYAFAGAEKLKESTSRIWLDKFSVQIYEGYGVTETSPVLAVNTKLHFKLGTVGRLLPGIGYRLEKVSGIKDGGKLIVSGANIMLGYLLHDNHGCLVRPIQGEYDTGDVVSIDSDGFVTIKGRVKRFAKIAGEMISLAAVEHYLSLLWPEHEHVVVAIADEKKGEQLALVTTYQKAKREAITRYVHAEGIDELSIPRRIVIVKTMPLLATGKPDYVAIKEIIH